MKRFITFLLAIVLTITSLPVTTLATDADTTPPTLTVTTPTGTTETEPVIVYDSTAFSNKVTEATTTYTVTGTVSDNVGVTSVTVNGTNATIASEGSWTADITLKANAVTPITVVATDTSGNTTTKTEYANYRIYWDTDNDSNTINFVNFEEDFSVKYKANNNTGTVNHTEDHGDGVHKYSILWKNHPASTTTTDSRMRFFLAPEDVGTITEDGNLTMQIYSEKATGATMQVLLWCASTGAGAAKNVLYRTDLDTGIKIDWTGEKIIEINFNDLTKANSPSPDSIYFVELAANKGFSSGASGSADTVLYIQDMYIKKDATAPTLTVAAPEGTAEDAPTLAEGSTYTVSGTVTDAKGLKSLTVNGNSVIPDADGAWSYDVLLSYGIFSCTL